MGWFKRQFPILCTHPSESLWVVPSGRMADRVAVMCEECMRGSARADSLKLALRFYESVPVYRRWSQIPAGAVRFLDIPAEAFRDYSDDGSAYLAKLGGTS